MVIEKNIKRVGPLSVGQELVVDGIRCRIQGFPTRCIVFLKNIDYTLGEWGTAKLPLVDVLREADKMNVGIR